MKKLSIITILFALALGFVSCKEDPKDEPAAEYTLTVSPDNYEGLIGEQITLKAVLTPANPDAVIEWKSSSKGIISVDQKGRVKLLSEGSARITASCTIGDQELRDKVTVSATKDELILSTDSLPILKGRTDSLAAHMKSGSGIIRWSSSNEEVATIDENGVVTAIEYGYTQIKASCLVGNEEYVKYCGVLVQKDRVVVDKHSVEVHVGEGFMISGRMLGGQEEEFLWFTNNLDVLLVRTSKGTEIYVEGKAEGEAKLTAIAKDGSSDTCYVNVLGEYMHVNNSELKLEPGDDVALDYEGEIVSVMCLFGADVCNFSDDYVLTALQCGTAQYLVEFADGNMSGVVVTVDVFFNVSPEYAVCSIGDQIDFVFNHQPDSIRTLYGLLDVDVNGHASNAQIPDSCRSELLKTDYIFAFYQNKKLIIPVEIRRQQFSVSATQKVLFSPSMLCYDSLASRYCFVDPDLMAPEGDDFSHMRYLHIWGTGSRTSFTDYGPTIHDNMLGAPQSYNGKYALWTTPSMDNYLYVLKKRPNASKLVFRTKLNHLYSSGRTYAHYYAVLLPDAWVTYTPAGFSRNSSNELVLPSGTTLSMDVLLTREDYNELRKAGAVVFQHNDGYFKRGIYWTSTFKRTYNGNDFAYIFEFNSSEISPDDTHPTSLKYTAGVMMMMEYR